jgi:hypothetical protein
MPSGLDGLHKRSRPAAPPAAIGAVFAYPRMEFVFMFDTKIVIVLRDDLATWQKLNVTAFLTSGLCAQYPAIIGEPYRDAAGNVYNAMAIQPVVVLAADQETLRKIHLRALERDVTTSAYVEEMFVSGHDAANREVFGQFTPENAKLAGIALRADRKIADKITKGAIMHK